MGLKGIGIQAIVESMIASRTYICSIAIRTPEGMDHTLKIGYDQDSSKCSLQDWCDEKINEQVKSVGIFYCANAQCFCIETRESFSLTL